MEELTIEQKAQKYDEAKARMSKAYNDNRCTIGFMNEIFPETKESEDKRIVKELLTFFRESIHGGHILTNKEYYSWIAWLEKQGNKDEEILVLKDKIESLHAAIKAIKEVHNIDFEKLSEQKSIDKIKPKFKVGDIIRHKEQRFTCKIIAIDTEYRLSGCNGNHLPFDSQDAYELVEQSPVWSKEDDSDFSAAMWAIEKAKTIAKDENDMGNLWRAERFLNSIKDRAQLQSKQEWSENDKYMLNNIIDTLKPLSQVTHSGYAINSMINWLESLKPKNIWKPNDEMLEALYRVIPKSVMEKSEDEVLLDKLYQGLKYCKILSEK